MHNALLTLVLYLMACHNECSGPGLCWPTFEQLSTISHMPLSQAPSATPEFPATISPPYDGDPLSATQLRTDDLTPLQNGIEASRMLLYGGGLKRRTTITSNTVMVISPLGAVLANLATKWTTIAHTSPTTINPATLSGGLAANTRYWVYAKIGAGPAFSFIVSTTAPDTGLSYMSGDESALWISTFYTDGSSNILTQSQSGFQFWYYSRVAFGGGAGGNLIYDRASPFGGVTVNYGAVVPSGARAVKLIAQVDGNPAAGWGKVGESAIINPDLIISNPTTAQSANGETEFSNNVTSCYIDADANTTNLALWVKGFTL